MKRCISLILLGLILTGTIAACGNPEPGDGTTQPSVSLTETPVESSDGGTSTMTESSADLTSDSTTTEVDNSYPTVENQPKIWTRTLDDTAYNLAGIAAVRNVGLITGDASLNRTRERFGVGGTDLGIPVFHHEKLYLFFGDTFRGDDEGHPMAGGGWRSNVLAYSEDTNLSDGLEIEAFIVNSTAPAPYAKEVIASRKSPGIEHTVIPTGALSLGDNLYAFFMSVKEWGAPGHWTINYGGLAKSTDDGQTFKKIEAIQFPGDVFGQISPLQVDDMIYLAGIGGGRYGNLSLMRVAPADVEDFSAYEYFAGMSGDTATFSSNAADSAAIVEGTIGEPSITYNAFLDEYILLYLDEPKAAIVMQVAKDLWGPWSSPLEVISSRDFPSLYGSFTHEAMTAEGGAVFYFTMSMWDPIYNSLLIEVKLERR